MNPQKWKPTKKIMTIIRKQIQQSEQNKKYNVH